MEEVNFIFLREGSSDEGLLPHLRTLLGRAGFTEVSGTPRAYRGSVLEKLTRVMEEDVLPNLIFVHRDSDAEDPEPRYAEIAAAAQELKLAIPCIGVVPIQEMEAWLLLSPDEIRLVVGKPSATVRLDLPKVARIESTKSPKELLRTSLLVASQTNGRRHRARAKSFDDDRQVLLQRLDIDGPILGLTAWQRLLADVGEFAATHGVAKS